MVYLPVDIALGYSQFWAQQIQYPTRLDVSVSSSYSSTLDYNPLVV